MKEFSEKSSNTTLLAHLKKAHNITELSHNTQNIE